jgi:hypothetical protein
MYVRLLDVVLFAFVLLGINFLVISIVQPTRLHDVKSTTAQEQVIVDSDKYIDHELRFGKDRYGNCWVVAYDNAWAQPIECSKIGR